MKEQRRSRESIRLRCVCGTLRGEIQPAGGLYRIACMCRWCQAYAHHLGQAERLLDCAGGTEVIQLAPAQLHFTEGAEQLRCLRMSRNGAMRFYTDCCHTPLGNTPDKAWVPWIGLPHLLVDQDALAASGRSVEEALGPVRYRIHARYATGPTAELVPAVYENGGPRSMLLGSLMGTAWRFAKGLGRPSPIFDLKTGKPRAEAVVLTQEQRKASGLQPAKSA